MMQTSRILRHSKKPGLILAVLLILLMGCDNRPDAATCNSYYRHLLELSSTEPPAIRIALQNTQARSAVLDYCMSLDRYRVQCSLKAGSNSEITACETGPESTFMDRMGMEWDNLSDNISSEFDDPPLD